MLQRLRLRSELQAVALARHGRGAIDGFGQRRPAFAFFDMLRAGLGGIDVACAGGSRLRVVFVTAHGRYAVQACGRDTDILGQTGARRPRCGAAYDAAPAHP